jgi:ketosteroid isomerase-like protein
MSQENVELLRRAVDAFNRRDLDAYLALQDAAVEFSPFERAVEGLGPYVGHQGIRSWWEDSFAALPDLSSHLDEVRDLGNITVARGRLVGQGAASGARFDRTLWMVVAWRDGKTVWWRAFGSEAEALEAAGESE